MQKVREWKSMTPRERVRWYGQARHGELGYGHQAALCAAKGHGPLTIWSFVGRVLCGSCGRTFSVADLPALTGEVAPAQRTAAA